MRTSTRAGPSTYPASDGSRTQTITNVPTQEGDDDDTNSSGSGHIVGSLRLRGTRRTQRVVWSDDVVDNEGCGKKKSKICCIYHKPRQFDESSSDESSDSDSDSDCGHHDHSSHEPHRQPDAGPSASGPQLQPESSSVVAGSVEDEEPSPNAYEKQPPLKKGKRRAT